MSVYAKKFIFIVLGDWENLTGNINIFDMCLCHSGQMPEQSLRYFPVPHPTHINFLVMCFSVINMWLSSNCFILLHSSTKLALGHQEANNSILLINESLGAREMSDLEFKPLPLG